MVGTEATGFSKNGADSIEDAPWSAAINPTDAYGYSIFDVDPGQRPGETTITFQYFAIPAVTNEAGSAHDGTTTLPTQPTEKFAFGRRWAVRKQRSLRSGQRHPGPGASACSMAASTCSRVVANTGIGLSCGRMRSSISVQPRITPSAPACSSRSMTSW